MELELPVIYPMGARTPNEAELEVAFNNKRVVAERKYDGSRYLIRKENGKVSIVSRQVSKSTGLPVEKTDRVPHLANFFEDILPDGTILDGEIITHENCESHEVTSIMGSSAEKAIAKQEERGLVQYVIFDIIFWGGKDLTNFRYIERRQVLEKRYKDGLRNLLQVKLAPVYLTGKEEQYLRIIEGGGEGVILKHADSTYEYSLDPKKIKKPQNTWYKVKKYDTFDVVITGFTEPTQRYTGKEMNTWPYWETPDGNLYYRQNEVAELLLEKGYFPVTKPYFNEWVGGVKYGQYKDGELVEIGQTSGITDDMQTYMTQNQSALIGTVVELGAMRQNKATGSLVHPRFLMLRPDKMPEQCKFGEA